MRAQRRQRDLHHLQPVVQPGAEAARPRPRRAAAGCWPPRCARPPGSRARCPVGGCGAPPARAAAAPAAARRQLGHLVEEEGAALRIDQQPVAALDPLAGSSRRGRTAPAPATPPRGWRSAPARRARPRAGSDGAGSVRPGPCRCPTRPVSSTVLSTAATRCSAACSPRTTIERPTRPSAGGVRCDSERRSTKFSRFRRARSRPCCTTFRICVTRKGLSRKSLAPARRASMAVYVEVGEGGDQHPPRSRCPARAVPSAAPGRCAPAA